MKRRVPFYILFSIVMAPTLVQTLHAGEFQTSPSLGIGSAYRHDDRTGRDGDLFLSPALSFQWANPSGQLGFNYGASIRGDLDQGTWHADGQHRLRIGNTTAWTPRLGISLSGDLTASPDETRGDFDNLDYGEVLVPETDTLHSGGKMGFSYQRSPLISNGLGFSYGQSRYEDKRLNDASWYGISLSQSRQLSPLSSVQVAYRLDRSDLDDFSLHGLNLAYRRTWSQTFSTAFHSGVVYDPRHEQRDFDGTYGLSTTQAFDRGSLSFSAGRSQGDRTRWGRVDNMGDRATLPTDSSTDGGLSDRGPVRGGGLFSSRTVSEHASLSGQLRLRENLDGTLRGSANRTESTSVQENRITTYTAGLGLHYRISKGWRANLAYQHIHQKTEIDLPTLNLGPLQINLPTLRGAFDSDSVSVSLSWHGEPWK